uniref:BED-type domain-containing protein n=1 Tax=Takifugu rubripes TaxID=31033 RepID=A0A674MCS2_TAKRU
MSINVQHSPPSRHSQQKAELEENLRWQTKNEAWCYYSPIDKNTARCQVCDKNVLHSSTTSNLFKHLKTKHPESHSELEKRQAAAKAQSPAPPTVRQKTLHESLQKSQSQRAREITLSLAKMIVKDLQPISMVEDLGFRHFMKVVDPRYQIPSRKSMMAGEIPKLYEQTQKTVKDSIQSASSLVLTTDMWTARTTESYLTVSGHFIDKNWKMQSCNLATIHVAVQHIADNIAELLTKITDEWGTTNKIHAVVTSGATAVRKTCWKHIPCFSHTLNLIVKDSIKACTSLESSLDKCSAIVRFFHHSTRATDKLKEVQNQLNLPQHKLIQAVDTRWNSVLYMIDRLYEQQEAIRTALCLLGRNNMCLSGEEWSHIKQAIDVLRPFEEATKEVSAEQYVTVSKVIPLVSLLQQATTSAAQSNSLASQLEAQCKRRFQNIEHYHTLAASTFLDIRFKNIVFCDSTNVEMIKSRLITEMQALPCAETPSTRHEAAFDSWVVAFQSNCTANTDAYIEIRRYMEEKVIPRSEDPLIWWEKNETTFPLLNKVAKKYLGTFAISVPAERLFSKSSTVGNPLCRGRRAAAVFLGATSWQAEKMVPTAQQSVLDQGGVPTYAGRGRSRDGAALQSCGLPSALNGRPIGTGLRPRPISLTRKSASLQWTSRSRGGRSLS